MSLRLSVVIPTCDRPDALAECLDRLSPEFQRLPADDCEIIVTDDGSRAPAEPALATRFPAVRWTPGPRRGPAANRNHGADLARGDVIVFIDDDCLPSPDLLAAYAAAFSDLTLRAAEGRIIANRPQTRMDEEAPINETGGFFWSCNIALRRDFFLGLGGFDERFPFAAMEDVELRERIRRRQDAIRFLPDALVIHPLRRMGGQVAVSRRAVAHGIYVLTPCCHLPPPRYRRAAFLILRDFCRRFLPRFFAFRGRGFMRASQHLLLPLWSVVEMKKALRGAGLVKK